MWYTFIWNFIKKPKNVIMALLVVVIGWLSAYNVSLKNDLANANLKIVERKGEIADLKGDVGVAENNTKKCLDVTALLEIDQELRKGAITALQEQLKSERETTVYWKRKFQNRPTVIKEVPVEVLVKEKQVIDMETSSRYVEYINSLME